MCSDRNLEWLSPPLACYIFHPSQLFQFDCTDDILRIVHPILYAPWRKLWGHCGLFTFSCPVPLKFVEFFRKCDMVARMWGRSYEFTSGIVYGKRKCLQHSIGNGNLLMYNIHSLMSCKDIANILCKTFRQTDAHVTKRWITPYSLKIERHKLLA